MTIILEVLMAKSKSYSQEEKQKMVSRMLPPENISANKLSRETGISISTLCIWKNNELSENNNSETKFKKNHKYTSEDKFQMVLETYTHTEEELSAYCRKKGIFVDDIKTWKNQCLKANVTNSKDPQLTEEDLKKEKQRTKDLEKELRIKDKALAETAALLVLRKKAQAIWGDPVDE